MLNNLIEGIRKFTTEMVSILKVLELIIKEFMNKIFVTIKSFNYVLLLLCIGCSVNHESLDDNLHEIDVAKWNQLTVNCLIDSFRLDTTSFVQFKQPPPESKNFAYSYPNYANIFNNDIATIWNFVNRRSCIINSIDSLYSKHSASIELEIIEYYRFYFPVVYEISDGKNSYKIVLNKNCDKIINKISKLSDLVSDFDDNRGGVAPVRTLTIMSKICRKANGSDKFMIKTLYIDSSVD
ncbi:hypothetical protein [Vallitalea sp.]|uniref:hypothetical protein n=1 Tax=Vallitalea sp. TaxID=1882829 RepID=UPI0025CF5DAC|nr:hypothetical protein [Vallitalea sp.]MCT4685690.1 hypothetical protein [Vallitalea sp.]